MTDLERQDTECPVPASFAWRRTFRAAVLELTMTTVMLFVVVTTTRRLMGTTDDAAGGWWNTPQGRLLAVAPIGGYTITCIMS
ncbi:hypothetical protein ACFWD7_11570 [Streptomyces mirabilis]|uniref:hypothetical protein n=1 Tax=Streptomyces mirabilis TaxID=68239 RepID=UPI0021C0A075|nr:hypothetical protein [Streptomyces mirabilis]MCT9108869.1 hypothetical protein [Streptomyces mirabilis]